MTILDTRLSYKPFKYPWAYEFYQQQTRELYWTPSTISFQQDLLDYKRLPPEEKRFIKNILSFFTQADIDVAGIYTQRYLNAFPSPEVRMMLLSFANMESTHIDAYSTLVNVLNIENYTTFLSYPEMKEKHEYLSPNAVASTPIELMLAILKGSAFGEGLQLFGSFAMLLSYGERGLFKGMRDVVQWSLRDETLHVRGMAKVFSTLRQEYPEYWNDGNKRLMYQCCRDMVELEDRFISLVYQDELQLPNLPKESLHEYIRYLADYRLKQFGLKPNYYVKENPLESLMGKFSGTLHEDFFSGTVTSYQHREVDKEALW